MKRIGNLYEKIYDINNIRLAFENVTRHKSHRTYIQKYISNSEHYAQKISDMLRCKTYIPNPNRTKEIKDGSCQKTRTITVPRFYPDQVIHWAVVQVLEPIFMHGMYEYSCGSIPGRGGKAVKRYIDKILRKDKKVKYILKLDISKFFPSVRHDKLKELLRKRIKDRDVLELLDTIIDSGNTSGVGLPIGYYSSQWLSNFYLQEVDHFIKEKLRIRHYIRYVDDMVLFDTNKRKLHKARVALADFFKDEGYGLQIKQNWQIWRIGSRPLDFVGYRYYQGYTLLRKRLFYHLTKTVRRIDSRGLNIKYARRYASLLGWCKHINFKNYYKAHIQPVVSQRTIKRYISRYDKSENNKKKVGNDP